MLSDLPQTPNPKPQTPLLDKFDIESYAFIGHRHDYRQQGISDIDAQARARARLRRTPRRDGRHAAVHDSHDRYERVDRYRYDVVCLMRAGQLQVSDDWIVGRRWRRGLKTGGEGEGLGVRWEGLDGWGWG